MERTLPARFTANSGSIANMRFFAEEEGPGATRLVCWRSSLANSANPLSWFCVILDIFRPPKVKLVHIVRLAFVGISRYACRSYPIRWSKRFVDISCYRCRLPIWKGFYHLMRRTKLFIWPIVGDVKLYIHSPFPPSHSKSIERGIGGGGPFGSCPRPFCNGSNLFPKEPFV